MKDKEKNKQLYTIYITTCPKCGKKISYNYSNKCSKCKEQLLVEKIKLTEDIIDNRKFNSNRKREIKTKYYGELYLPEFDFKYYQIATINGNLVLEINKKEMTNVIFLDFPYVYGNMKERIKFEISTYDMPNKKLIINDLNEFNEIKINNEEIEINNEKLLDQVIDETISAIAKRNNVSNKNINIKNNNLSVSEMRLVGAYEGIVKRNKNKYRCTIPCTNNFPDTVITDKKTKYETNTSYALLYTVASIIFICSLISKFYIMTIITILLIIIGTYFIHKEEQIDNNPKYTLIERAIDDRSKIVLEDNQKHKPLFATILIIIGLLICISTILTKNINIYALIIVILFSLILIKYGIDILKKSKKEKDKNTL